MTIFSLLQDTTEFNSPVLSYDALKSTHLSTCRYKTKCAHWQCQELKQAPIYILPPCLLSATKSSNSFLSRMHKNKQVYTQLSDGDGILPHSEEKLS